MVDAKFSCTYGHAYRAEVTGFVAGQSYSLEVRVLGPGPALLPDAHLVLPRDRRSLNFQLAHAGMDNAGGWTASSGSIGFTASLVTGSAGPNPQRAAVQLRMSAVNFVANGGSRSVFTTISGPVSFSCS